MAEFEEFDEDFDDLIEADPEEVKQVTKKSVTPQKKPAPTVPVKRQPLVEEPADGEDEFEDIDDAELEQELEDQEEEIKPKKVITAPSRPTKPISKPSPIKSAPQRVEQREPARYAPNKPQETKQPESKYVAGVVQKRYILQDTIEGNVLIATDNFEDFFMAAS